MFTLLQLYFKSCFPTLPALALWTSTMRTTVRQPRKPWMMVKLMAARSPWTMPSPRVKVASVEVAVAAAVDLVDLEAAAVAGEVVVALAVVAAAEGEEEGEVLVEVDVGVAALEVNEMFAYGQPEKCLVNNISNNVSSLFGW